VFNFKFFFVEDKNEGFNGHVKPNLVFCINIVVLVNKNICFDCGQKLWN
jgi:hypothetical protein